MSEKCIEGRVSTVFLLSEGEEGGSGKDKERTCGAVPSFVLNDSLFNRAGMGSRSRNCFARKEQAYFLFLLCPTPPLTK